VRERQRERKTERNWEKEWQRQLKRDRQTDRERERDKKEWQRQLKRETQTVWEIKRGGGREMNWSECFRFNRGAGFYRTFKATFSDAFQFTQFHNLNFTQVHINV
jgi:hypothetical protein